jgi:carboxylesterase type B
MRSIRRASLATGAAMAVLAAGLSAAPAQADPGRIVPTDKGPVAGTVTDTHRTFLAIPYAAPPVGDLRWRDPQPAQRWTAPRDATNPAPSCAQPSTFGTGSTSEDCLYLNVTTPRGPGHGRLRPVMVWLHGGGFAFGDGDDYGALRLATDADAVIVTVNYRLGAFGYFGYPGLEGSGAFGLADQLAALRWVQRNARAFGGDPDNVTLFGHSAGGISACGHLASPLAQGLFHRAIIHSGPCSIPGMLAAREDVEAAGLGLATGLGCADLDCLRRLPVDTLLSFTIHDTFSLPAYNTRVWPREPAQALRDGQYHRIPVLLGTTRDEHTLVTVLQHPRPIPPENYPAVLAQEFGAELVDSVLARYPLNGDNDARPELASALTDNVWACPTARDSRQLAQGTSVHGYEFADRTAPLLLVFQSLPPFEYLAYHSSELPYLFEFGSVTLNPQQQQLSEQMIHAWGHFAAAGDPGWPGYPQVQSLAPGAIQPVNYEAEHQCAFWFSVR